MKLRSKTDQFTESLLKVGLSDDLDKFASSVSDKSGDAVVKKNNTIRNLDYKNQKGGEIRKDVERYDDLVAKQVKASVKRQVESLKRKYLSLIESVKTESNFKFKGNTAVKKPVFEEVKLPSRKKISKPIK